jgi:hypothetical protein
MINFLSAHPITMKMNVAKSFIGRVVKLTSINDDDWIREEVFSTLKKNNYPSALIKRWLNDALNRRNHNNTTQILPQRNVEKIFRSLQLVPGMSQQLSKVARKWNEDLTISCKPLKTASSWFTRLKDKLPLATKSDVIYSFPCRDCLPKEMTRYYGKSHQLAGETEKQHALLNKKLIDCRELRNGSAKEAKERELSMKTSWLEHAIDSGYSFDVGKMKIHHQSTSYTKLAILEMLYIVDDTGSMNCRRDVAYLSSAYSNILRLRKENNLKR